MQFLAPSGSVCKRQFAEMYIDLVNVKLYEETKADEDKIDQVINSITVHSNNVRETASMSQGMIFMTCIYNIAGRSVA